jgi:hypothetical protein
VDRHNAVLAGAAVKARHAVLLDVGVLCNQLTQQRAGLLDRLLVEQSFACSTARTARSVSWATRVSIRSR